MYIFLVTINKGKIVVKDKEGKGFSVSTKDLRYLNGELIPFSCGVGNKGANKGQTRSLEMRKTFGIKHIGNKYSLGRIDSIHTKEKQKISHIGNNNALGKGKKIIQKDLAGNIIQIGTINTYPKIFKPSGIYACCNNKIEKYKNFIWEYNSSC